MSGMLHILGARLATEIEKDENVCRGMLRIAIADSVERLQKTMDHRTWMEHLNSMSFRDWEAVLQGGGLSQRLSNMGIKDSADVVAKLRRTLVEKQSLLTMSAR